MKANYRRIPQSVCAVPFVIGMEDGFKEVDAIDEEYAFSIAYWANYYTHESSEMLDRLIVTNGKIRLPYINSIEGPLIVTGLHWVIQDASGNRWVIRDAEFVKAYERIEG